MLHPHAHHTGGATSSGSLLDFCRALFSAHVS